MKKNNSKVPKVLTLLCCAVLLVTISVGVTIAYLTSTDSVKNTFTVGNVKIKLDEAPLDATGKATTGARVKENLYHMTPGEEYDKDPTITIEANSEPCYVVAKMVVSGIDKDDSKNPLVKDGMLDFTNVLTGGLFPDKTGMKVVQTVASNTDGKETFTFMIYFTDVVAKDTADQTKVLFETVEVPATWTNDQIATLEGMKIDITAYAMQASGFNSAEEAYTTCFVNNSGSSTT